MFVVWPSETKHKKLMRQRVASHSPSPTTHVIPRALKVKKTLTHLSLTYKVKERRRRKNLTCCLGNRNISQHEPKTYCNGETAQTNERIPPNLKTDMCARYQMRMVRDVLPLFWFKGERAWVCCSFHTKTRMKILWSFSSSGTLNPYHKSLKWVSSLILNLVQEKIALPKSDTFCWKSTFTYESSSLSESVKYLMPCALQRPDLCVQSSGVLSSELGHSQPLVHLLFPAQPPNVINQNNFPPIFWNADRQCHW